MIRVSIPGHGDLGLEHLVLDLNGTIAYRGTLIEGVLERLEALAGKVGVHLLSADTRGTADGIAAQIGARLHTTRDGDAKLACVADLEVDRSVCIGNGANDVEMLRHAALGVAVLGPEGLAGATLVAADVIVPSILHALDLLIDPLIVIATLRN